VLAVIQQTGYQPNVAARSLRTKSSNILGLVIPESVQTLYTDPFFLQLNQGTTQACNAHDKTLALFVESNEDTLIPRVTRGGHLDGVVVQSGYAHGRLIRALIEARIPFVVAGGRTTLKAPVTWMPTILLRLIAQPLIWWIWVTSVLRLLPARLKRWPVWIVW
jgi:DNA-binding LacI/PurR family transcriptional regulator